MTVERPTLEEAEVQVALAAGVLAADEADLLKEEARHQARGPLLILLRKGRLSDETFASLTRDAREVAAPPKPHVEDGPTLVRGNHAAGPSPAGGPDAPPVIGWDRYQCIRLLGEGGMGRVYLAYDPRLQRNVALKFVKDGERDFAQRFAFEARAQARIDHPSVGKVYEVGEVEGKPFIAMQYVDGEPLHLAAPSLGLERKVMLLRDAALGVGEAHRVGIIHRDLKPSNLMVERAGSAEPRIFVMDFGLARDWSASSTAAGSVLGTPQYMAPEQASGDVATLDRRVDVYALGATLYHVLCGEPPIPGANALEVLRNVFTVEPRPLRQIAPDVPEDLQAVVMKCLEKSRSDRYDSARALADDLDRFLAGQPVQARAYGSWERAKKFVRRHRRAVAAAGAAAAVVLAAVGWGARARYEASRREQLARAFTEKVERIESAVRYSQLSPLHDTTPDLQALKARMAELAADVSRGGASARGPGEYALGRGALALGDARGALEHLQAAWEAGFREPRVAYALALVNGQLYREGLEAAERAGSKDVREAARRDVEKRYRDPALELLKQSEGAEVPSPEYVAALVAFYEGRLDDALGHVDAVGAELPWFFEAPLLRAQILTARARRLADAGDSKHAEDDFERARAAAKVATTIGESVPSIYLALAQIEYSAMRAAIYSKGDAQAPFDRGQAAAALALRAAPRSVEALVLEASFYRRLGELRAGQGGDADESFQRAVEAARAARAAAPDLPEGAFELAKVLGQWALRYSAQGRDPRALLDQALDLLRAASARGQGYELTVVLGSLHHTRAGYEEQIGLDPAASYAQAIAAYLKATELEPGSAAAWVDLGDAYKARGSRSGDAAGYGDLERAAASLDRAKALNPENVAIYFHAADLRETMASRSRARGDDPRPVLAEALELYRAGSALNPRLPQLHLGAGSVLRSLAVERWDRGEDPEPSLREAIATFQRAIELAPEQGFGQNNLAGAYLQQAEYELALGRDPSAALDQAEVAIRAALERIPRRAEPWAILGGVQWARARRDQARGRDPSPRLRLADEALATALRINSKSALAWRYAGEVSATRAGLDAERGRPPEAGFQKAVEALERGIGADPRYLELQLALARTLRAWGSWRAGAGLDGKEALGRAQAAAEQVLRARPRWPEAIAVRAAVAVAAAADPEQVEEARQQLAGALRENQNLEPQWRPLASKLVR